MNLDALDKMFIARFAKIEAELNKNVYLAPITDNDTFEVPVVTLGKGGGTFLNKETESLNAPAVVSLIHQEVEAFRIVYRIAVPRAELEIAFNKPEYFNYLLDSIINKAINNYRVTVGDEHKVRFGSYYLSFKQKDGTVFNELNDDLVEFQMQGLWAKEEGTKPHG